jgi:hypothetical protein
VNGDRRSCYYQIADKTAAPNAAPRPLSDGQAPTFEVAERLVRETIGKAYRPTLGYSRYAGALATTFKLGNGTQTDLGIYEGVEVIVTAATQGGAATVYEGRARVEHYDLILERGTTAIRITPSYVMDIKVSPVASRVAKGPGINRTFQGRVEPTCTGTPGFLPNTVEHSGRICPIHEER